MTNKLMVPQHVAIIMDGNGRWAKHQGRARAFGHRAGHTAVLRTVRRAVSIGIQHLTLFAFSSENWQRPSQEVESLMQLFGQALKRNRWLFMKHRIRFRVIGDVGAFSQGLQQSIHQLEVDTQQHRTMTVNIAANYGGKWDIVQAAKSLAKAVRKGMLSIDDIDEVLFAAHLTEQAPVDLLIRTGGEQRISNYLLWQSAYAEFYFTEQFWPDFNAESLDAAVADYQQRTRRFGRVLGTD